MFIVRPLGELYAPYLDNNNTIILHGSLSYQVLSVNCQCLLSLTVLSTHVYRSMLYTIPNAAVKTIVSGGDVII